MLPPKPSADNVWYARDVTDNTQVVIKLFDMEQFPDHEGLRDAKTRAEVDILKELSSKYPNRVVQYLDFYANDEDQLVLVMER